MARILGSGGGATGRGGAPQSRPVVRAQGGGVFDQIAAGFGGGYDQRAFRAVQLMQLRNLLGAPPDASMAGGLGNLSVISGLDRVALPDNLLQAAIAGGVENIVEPLARKKKDQFQQLRIDPVIGMVF